MRFIQRLFDYRLKGCRSHRASQPPAKPRRKTAMARRLSARRDRRGGCWTVSSWWSVAVVREDERVVEVRRTMTCSGSLRAETLIAVCRPLETSRAEVEVCRPRSSESSRRRTCPRLSHSRRAQSVAESGRVVTTVSWRVSISRRVSVVCRQSCVNVVELLQLATHRTAGSVRVVQNLLECLGEVSDGRT